MSGRLIILPKKQWHVRNQDNIDRVRRDEAKAAAEEADRESRRQLAEREARVRLLRERARGRLDGPGAEAVEAVVGPLPPEKELAEVTSDMVTSDVTEASGHINFFQDAEKGEDKVTTNAEHEAEKKKEQEEYEKKVGYLVKLGQDTEELDGGTAWWKKAAGSRLLEPTPSQLKATATGSLAAVRAKQTEFLDPLNSVRKYLGCEGVRLTMKSHQKMMEEKERKALDFDDVKDIKKVEKKHKKKERKRSRSKSRGKKRKRSRSRESRQKKKKSKDKKSKKKRRRRSSSSSSDSDSSSDGDSAEKKAIAKKNLEKLRRERLERERAERQKADRLVFGECEEDKKKKQEEEEKEKKQRYSSQFNPDLAKQNKLDPKRKYWLE